jgi:hypothetical protein
MGENDAEMSEAPALYTWTIDIPSPYARFQFRVTLSSNLKTGLASAWINIEASRHEVELRERSSAWIRSFSGAAQTSQKGLWSHPDPLAPSDEAL